jgi:hypothetical protein
VLVILVAAVGGGLLLCVGGIAAVAMFFLSSDEPGPAAPHVPVAATGPGTLVEPSPAQPADPVSPAPVLPVSTINWVAYENSSKGFTAVFPGGPPQPLDPLADIKDPQQRELVAAFMEDWTVLGVTHGGRKYTLTAAPLELGNVPADVYLDRMAGGLEAIHAGFTLDAQPKADASAPIRDYVLKKEGAGKLLRVVASGGHVYQLLIEGEAGLAFSDPAAREFFERFQAGGVSSAAVAADEPKQGKTKSKTKSKRRPSEASAEPIRSYEPDGIDWRPLRGNKLAFTVNFPGVTASEEFPLAPVPEPSRANLEKSWTEMAITVESFVAQVGDRRYAVAAFRSSLVPGPGSNELRGQLESLTRMYAVEIYGKSRGRGISGGESPAKWDQWHTASHTIQGGRKVIVRRALKEPYGFVARVEGPATMDDMDSQVHKFFDSLMPPPDAASPSP